MQSDILIPLGHGSKHDNFELRMCLRSIEKHLKGVGNIFLVGEKPDWVQNVIHIPARDNPNNWNRARNIYDKIMAGVNFKQTIFSEFWDNGKLYSELSDNFLFMNDDHYLLTDYEAWEFPYYHRGLFNLPDLLKKKNNPQYRQTQNTFEYGFSQGFDFDVHCPIIFNKKIFNNVFGGLPTKWPEHGFLIKSYYANAVTFEHSELVTCEDLKFNEPLMKESIYRALEDRSWFSIGDKCLKSGAMKEVLSELYPNKSKYER